MTAHSKVIIEKFLEICRSTMKFWHLRKSLFDNNPDKEIFNHVYYAGFFHCLDIMSQEYSLLQVTKLHDPAVQGQDINLSIDYIINYGSWEKQTLEELVDKRKKLISLLDKIKSARNKILSHNDLKIILNNEVLGSFPEGADEDYFNCLIEFCEIVSQTALAEPFTYDVLIKTDVLYFMKYFNTGQTTRDI